MFYQREQRALAAFGVPLRVLTTTDATRSVGTLDVCRRRSDSLRPTLEVSLETRRKMATWTSASTSRFRWSATIRQRHSRSQRGDLNLPVHEDENGDASPRIRPSSTLRSRRVIDFARVAIAAAALALFAGNRATFLARGPLCAAPLLSCVRGDTEWRAPGLRRWVPTPNDTRRAGVEERGSRSERDHTSGESVRTLPSTTTAT